jgi:hypothetical protein
MPAWDDFDWRDRAIALASLGAVALGRTVFETADILGERPLKPVEMQALVALALQDSLAVDPPQQTDMHWLSRTLGLEPWVAEEIVGRLERAGLVRPLGEVQYEHGPVGDRDETADRPSIAVTEPGLQIVASWLRRTRRHFRSWPPEQHDVDDATD